MNKGMILFVMVMGCMTLQAQKNSSIDELIQIQTDMMRLDLLQKMQDRIGGSQVAQVRHVPQVVVPEVPAEGFRLWAGRTFSIVKAIVTNPLVTTALEYCVAYAVVRGMFCKLVGHSTCNFLGDFFGLPL